MLLAEFSNIFNKLGKPISHTVDHKTDLLDLSAVPPCLYLYCISEDELKAVKSTIKEKFEKGWILPSTSPYGAPIIIVCKKMGKLRIVVDYQILNK